MEGDAKNTTACGEQSRTDDKRGLECRHGGCKHFRVIYPRPTWVGRSMRRRGGRHVGTRMRTVWQTGGVGGRADATAGRGTAANAVRRNGP